MQNRTVDSMCHYSLLSSFENEKSLCVYDIQDGRSFVIGKRGDLWIVASNIPNEMIIEADCVTHEMRVLDNEERPLVMSNYDRKQSYDGCVDLTANGRRWEGGVKDRKPFGYGTLYDEEGRKEYEGFMKNGRKIAYGTEYYADIGQIKYRGCYCDDYRFGYGVLYDRRGAIEHEGFWIYRVLPNSVVSRSTTILSLSAFQPTRSTRGKSSRSLPSSAR